MGPEDILEKLDIRKITEEVTKGIGCLIDKYFDLETNNGSIAIDKNKKANNYIDSCISKFLTKKTYMSASFIEDCSSYNVKCLMRADLTHNIENKLTSTICEDAKSDKDITLVEALGYIDSIKSARACLAITINVSDTASFFITNFKIIVFYKISDKEKTILDLVGMSEGIDSVENVELSI
jgi:hypothetical protein